MCRFKGPDVPPGEPVLISGNKISAARGVNIINNVASVQVTDNKITYTYIGIYSSYNWAITALPLPSQDTKISIINNDITGGSEGNWVGEAIYIHGFGSISDPPPAPTADEIINDDPVEDPYDPDYGKTSWYKWMESNNWFVDRGIGSMLILIILRFSPEYATEAEWQAWLRCFWPYEKFVCPDCGRFRPVYRMGRTSGSFDRRQQIGRYRKAFVLHNCFITWPQRFRNQQCCCAE